MTVFKTFWKIVNKYKGTIIGYTVMLLVFGTINMSSNDVSQDFKSSKPSIIVVDNDKSVLSSNLINYLASNANIEYISDEEDIDDAIFYRDSNYVIYIPSNYQSDVINNRNPEIKIKSSKDYLSSLAQMMLERYMKVQDIVKIEYTDVNELVSEVNNVLSFDSDIEVMSKVNTTELERLSRYYNFASYSIIAVVMFIICLVLLSFKENGIRKRTIVSSMDYKKYNRCILGASLIYVVLVVILYIILGYFVFGSIVFNKRGLIYILNTLLFSFVILTLSILVSSLLNKREAISGVVNVVALSQAFLCGAFIPVMWLPNSVLFIARVFPAYWYINSNEVLASIEVINFSNLQSVLVNMVVLVIYIVVFIILNNIVAKKRRVLC